MQRHHGVTQRGVRFVNIDYEARWIALNPGQVARVIILKLLDHDISLVLVVWPPEFEQ